jgi:energy-converting hydrogenase Eha subunit B
VSLAELRGDVVILACAVSAGIHAALVREHPLGFAVATFALAALAVWLTQRPASVPALAGAVAVLGGLLAAYALAATTGLPVLHPDPEPVDGLALATKAIEAVGLLAASTLLLRPVHFTLAQPKGTTT